MKVVKHIYRLFFALCIGFGLMNTPRLAAQTNVSIFSDGLNNGFQNWSWGNVSFDCLSPIYDGTNSISYDDAPWQGISFWHSDFNPAPYTNLDFWLNGGSMGGQVIQVYLQYSNSVFSGITYQLPALSGGSSWQHIFIPFSTLGVATVSNLSRINLQLTPYGTTNEFYLDDVNLTLIPPSLVHLEVDARQTLRSADARWFGLNTAVWDSYLDTPTTESALQELNTHILRFPGGSLADDYHWATDTTDDNTWQWNENFNNFINVITNTGAQTIITVNYGSGTPAEAAAWVASANVTNHLGFKYWEVGNECYGTWETDSNTVPHDGFTYASRAAQYISQMKAVDPTIKIGVPVVTGEDTDANGNTTHPAYNPRTGETNYGWTPVVLSTMTSLGVRPDFLVYHVYPEYDVDNDQQLLQAATNWAPNAADLRQQITDYVGSPGTNTELLCTENNADSGNQGKQSTSIVNGLYLADSLAQLTKTEFNGFVWWDLRNGTDTSGDFSSSLYGWRTYGDLGIISGLNTRNPVYFTFKLMQYFAQPGDTVLDPSSDYATLLPVYSTRKSDGSLAVLVINKDESLVFNAQISLANFIPGTNALVRSFGITQDEATRTNSTVPGAQDVGTNYITVTGTNFTTQFLPYSVTLVTIPPASPGLTIQALANNQTVLQVKGQPSVPYLLESSTNLTDWLPVLTNTLSGTTWNVTNPMTAQQLFWRAAWQP
jgi:alpha-L-arabinofuranosidase